MFLTTLPRDIESARDKPKLASTPSAFNPQLPCKPSSRKESKLIEAGDGESTR